MSKKVDEQSQIPYLTPFTCKLMQLREGKGPGMLNDEEIELLRMSQKEISIGSSIASKSMINNADRVGYIGMLSVAIFLRVIATISVRRLVNRNHSFTVWLQV